jgi:hypothetical protein
MTQGPNTKDSLDQLIEDGYHWGWSHANYAIAYGEEICTEPTRPTGLSDVEFSYYLSGYDQGIKEYIAHDSGFYDTEEN